MEEYKSGQLIMDRLCILFGNLSNRDHEVLTAHYQGKRQLSFQQVHGYFRAVPMMFPPPMRIQSGQYDRRI